MIGRCYNPSAFGFSYYGGKGIIVCDRWRKSFASFLADVGERPSRAHTLDRINGCGNYEPQNCRWATKREQAKNRKTTNFYLFGGEKLTLREIAERTGFTYECLRHRVVRAGWSIEEAVSAPMQKGQRRDLRPFV